MAKQTVTNLHKSALGMNKQNFVGNIRAKITEFGDQVRDKLPTLLGHVDVASHLKLGKLKKKFLKNLNTQRKKFRLALESLGWGTLADLLEHAFNGEELNVVV